MYGGSAAAPAAFLVNPRLIIKQGTLFNKAQSLSVVMNQNPALIYNYPFIKKASNISDSTIHSPSYVMVTNAIFDVIEVLTLLSRCFFPLHKTSPLNIIKSQNLLKDRYYHSYRIAREKLYPFLHQKYSLPDWRKDCPRTCRILGVVSDSRCPPGCRR